MTKDYLSVTVNDVTTKYDQTTTYAYNLRNQMTASEVKTPVANENTGEVAYETEGQSYLYNAGEQRMKKYEEGDDVNVDDDTTRYFYTGSALFYTTFENGALNTENIIDPSGQIIASKRFDDDFDSGTPYELANQYFFYHYDVRGNVTNIVRPDGKLIGGLRLCPEWGMPARHSSIYKMLLLISLFLFNTSVFSCPFKLRIFAKNRLFFY